MSETLINKLYDITEKAALLSAKYENVKVGRVLKPLNHIF